MTEKTSAVSPKGAAAKPTKSAVRFRAHKIPTADSRPYICVEGPDGNLWFCESGASRIGRLNVAGGRRVARWEIYLRLTSPNTAGTVRRGGLWFVSSARTFIRLLLICCWRSRSIKD